jgi:hypothetical protein|tara:strand:- start:281 stop:502 length:222 start_codon:yes stop_codon:yes gene_type:complete
MKRIVYKYLDGVAVIAPAPNWLKEGHTVEEAAKKDVPTGTKYKIVDASEIPSDRSFRNAWEVDEELLTDGVGE